MEISESMSDNSSIIIYKNAQKKSLEWRKMVYEVLPSSLVCTGGHFCVYFYWYMHYLKQTSLHK